MKFDLANIKTVKTDLTRLKNRLPAELRERSSDLRKRLQVRSSLGITLESGRLLVDLVRREENHIRLLRSLSLPFGADAVVADPEKVGKELAALLEGASIRERRCAACIPPGWAVTMPVDLPDMSPEDLRGYFELHAEREFPVNLSELRLAHCPYTLPDGKRRATLALVPAKRLEAVERMLATAGCKVGSISLGLDRCVDSDLASGRGSLHFLANGNHVDLAASAGGGIVALRSLALADKTKFFSEVRITLGRLPEALRRQIREGIFEGAPESARKLFGELGDSLRRLGVESRLRTAADGFGADETLGSGREAAGLLLAGRTAAFEFIIPQVNRWQVAAKQFDSKRRRWLVAAVLGLIVLPILVFFIRSSIENNLNDEWNAMRRTVGELETIQQNIRKYRPWFDSTPRSLQILEGLTAAFPDNGDVWVKNIELSGGSKVTCTGFARSQAAFEAMREELRRRPDVSGLQVQQVRGENPLQFAMTYKWETHDDK